MKEENMQQGENNDVLKTQKDFEHIDYTPSRKGLSIEEQEAIAKEATKARDDYISSNSSNIDVYNDFTRFVLGDQWDSAEAQVFSAMDQSVYTVNKLYAINRAIVGEFIQTSPEMESYPITGKADEDLVNFYQDHINTISYQSNGKIIWKESIGNTMNGGFGVIQVDHDYAGDETLQQEIVLRPCPDPTRAFFDIAAKERSKCDGNYCGLSYTMPLSQAQAQNPKFDFEDAESRSSDYSGKYSEAEKSVNIIYYQRKEWYQQNYIETEDGSLKTPESYKMELNDYYLQQEAAAMQAFPGLPGDIITKESRRLMLPRHLKKKRDRKLPRYKIRAYKICGNRVIEHADWPSKYFGLIFVDGDSHYVDGEWMTRPLMSDARNPQKMLNLVETKIQHQIQTLRGEQWLATADHIAGYEDIWRRTDNVVGALPYNPSDDGVSPPRPEQIMPPSISPALFEAASRAEQSIYTCVGLNAAYRGEADTQYASGKAIKQEITQGNRSVMVFFDGVFDAMTQAGKVICDMTPKIYDTNRIVHLISKNGERREVEINGVDAEGRKFMDLSSAKYSVAIKAGPSFEMQRENIMRVLTTAMQAFPTVAPFIADKFLESMPVPGASMMAKRAKATIPPEIIAAGEGKKLPPPPPPPPDPMIEIKNKELDLKFKELDHRSQELEKRGQEMQLSMDRMRIDMFKMIENAKLQTMKTEVEMHKSGLEFEERMHTAQERREQRGEKMLESLSKIGINL